MRSCRDERRDQPHRDYLYGSRDDRRQRLGVVIIDECTVAERLSVLAPNERRVGGYESVNQLRSKQLTTGLLIVIPNTSVCSERDAE